MGVEHAALADVRLRRFGSVELGMQYAGATHIVLGAAADPGRLRQLDRSSGLERRAREHAHAACRRPERRAKRFRLGGGQEADVEAGDVDALAVGTGCGEVGGLQHHVDALFAQRGRVYRGKSLFAEIARMRTVPAAICPAYSPRPLIPTVTWPPRIAAIDSPPPAKAT